jgi:hypothetical protein
VRILISAERKIAQRRKGAKWFDEAKLPLASQRLNKK